MFYITPNHQTMDSFFLSTCFHLKLQLVRRRDHYCRSMVDIFAPKIPRTLSSLILRGSLSLSFPPLIYSVLQESTQKPSEVRQIR